LTLLAWSIGMGVFIVLLKYCGGCKRAKCDARSESHAKPAPGARTDDAPSP
jgi:hypothetical protein